MGFAGPWRPQQNHVFFAGKEVELAQVFGDLAFDRELKLEVELLQRLPGRKAGSPDSCLAAVGFTGRDLG